nr:transposase [Blastococcus colisei]
MPAAGEAPAAAAPRPRDPAAHHHHQALRRSLVRDSELHPRGAGVGRAAHRPWWAGRRRGPWCEDRSCRRRRERPGHRRVAGVRALRDRLRHVQHLQRAVPRAQRGSANRRKAVARLGRAHARAAAVRANALHRFTAELAREHGDVVVEDLATKNLMANRSLAAAIGDQGWGELARQLAYKTARHGGRLIVADRWLASSKTCSACGGVRPKLTLAERSYRCADDSCGHVADRDVNAAANLAAWGEHTLGSCPCVTQAGDRHPGGPSAGTRRHACGGWVSATASQVAAVLPGEARTSQPRPGAA